MKRARDVRDQLESLLERVEIEPSSTEDSIAIRKVHITTTWLMAVALWKEGDRGTRPVSERASGSEWETGQARASEIFSVSEWRYIRASRSERNLKWHMIFHARHASSRILAVVKVSVLLRVSVALSVWPSYSATVSKQCSLRSTNLHCQLPQIWLEF